MRHSWLVLLILCGLAPLALAGVAGESVLYPVTPLTHATDCSTGVTTAYANEFCVDQDDGRLWFCRSPGLGGATDVMGNALCDQVAEWSEIVGRGIEKNSVSLATTGEVTLSGEQVLDGIQTLVNRVLVWKQGNAAENGIYVTGAGAWTRAVDADSSGDFAINFSVYVEQGTLYEGLTFRLRTIPPITLDTTALLFTPTAIPTITFANLPVSVASETLAVVTDTTSDCSGAGTTMQVCRWNGVAWVVASSESITLDAACATGDDCAFTNLPPNRPLIIAPEGLMAVKEQTYGEGGDLVHDCLDGSSLEQCHPKMVQIHPDREYVIQALMGDPATWTDIETISNVGGTSIVRTGGWEIPFSAAGLVVDGTNCVLASKTQVNSGPSVLPVSCLDAAGTLELGFLSPSRWTGDPLTVSFVVIDSTSSSHVWAATVKAMCRTPGVTEDAINNTWGTAATAQVTMVTANVPYLASATVTPNTGCARGDWVSIHATILNAGAHTDANALVVGGKISSGL